MIRVEIDNSQKKTPKLGTSGVKLLIFLFNFVGLNIDYGKSYFTFR